METVLLLSAPIWGFFLGTLLFAKVGRWVQTIVEARKGSSSERKALPLVAILHSGPWLLAVVAYWAYHVLSQTHAPAWRWFFGAAAIALPLWLTFSVYMHFRSKHAKRTSEDNAV